MDAPRSQTPFSAGGAWDGRIRGRQEEDDVDLYVHLVVLKEIGLGAFLIKKEE